MEALRCLMGEKRVLDLARSFSLPSGWDEGW
jgi:hypothetical protein